MIFENEEGVQMSAEDYSEIKEQLRWLECLESAGVDNWGGIDFAQELFNEEEE